MNFFKKSQTVFVGLPKATQSLLMNVSKFVVFMLIWFSSTNIIGFFNQPKHLKPTKEIFSICVLVDQKPQVVRLTERENLPLCQKNYEKVYPSKYASFDFEKVDVDNNEWQLTRWSDSMSDPWAFRYQIIDGNVNPLWLSYGGLMITIANSFLAYIVSFFVFRLLGSVYKRLNNKFH